SVSSEIGSACAIIGANVRIKRKERKYMRIILPCNYSHSHLFLHSVIRRSRMFYTLHSSCLV
ncbi:MAG: hypothetical protein OEY94_08480, partial [Alphaproteobacteria bacterium]|nr:hypothetical protein [Alphaproteobacteria bacterium]